MQIYSFFLENTTLCDIYTITIGDLGQSSVTSFQLSVFSCQLSDVGYQLSVFSCQLSDVGCQLSGCLAG